MDTETLKRLDELGPHSFGMVERVDAQDDDMERLMAMGVCAGRNVQVVQHGDPLILKIFGSRIGVSARLAHRVWVSDCHPEDCPLNVLSELEPDDEEDAHE